MALKIELLESRKIGIKGGQNPQIAISLPIDELITKHHPSNMKYNINIMNIWVRINSIQILPDPLPCHHVLVHRRCNVLLPVPIPVPVLSGIRGE